MFPYKEELSVGKMEFAASGDDLHLSGDLRATMEGFTDGGGGIGSMAFVVFLLLRSLIQWFLVVKRERGAHTLRNEEPLCGFEN